MSEGLQFDRAESAGPSGSSACTVCQRTLTDAYYVARDARFCGICRSAYEEHVGQGPTIGRLAVATLCGIAAAFAADAAYALVLRGQIGVSLVALLAGVIVGFAVRKGSGNRGGRACQIIAMLLTYLAIVGAFVPLYYARSQSPEGMAPLDYLQILAEPFLAAKRSIWILMLTGFALYEAWNINRAPRLNFHGPFQVGADPGKIAGG